jgi:hypothetical protein
MATDTKNKIKPTDAAYLAGFVDADGYIGIVSVATNKNYVSQISVANRSRQIVDEFKRLFGGQIRARNVNHPNWQVCYEWKLTSRKACYAIKILLPYLRIKKSQANLALEVQEIKDKHSLAEKRWDPDIKVEQDRLCLKLKEACAALNKRGLV